MQENNFYDFNNESSKDSVQQTEPLQDTETTQDTNITTDIENTQSNGENYSSGAKMYMNSAYILSGMTLEEYQTKKEIRKAATVAGSAFLTVFGVVFLWAILLGIAMGILGFSEEKIYSLIQDPAFLNVVQIVLSSFMFTIPFIIAFKCGGFCISELISFKKPEKRLFFPLFLIGISFCAFANIAVSYAGSIFQSFGINYEVDMGDTPKGFFGFCLSLISIVLVPALVEEIACRGLVMGALRKFSDSFALITSAILFGVMHGNFEQMTFAFFVGLVLGFTVIKTNSIWIAVAIHGFNNLISLTFSYLPTDLSMTVQNLMYTLLLQVLLVLGIIGILMLKDKNHVFEFNRADTQVSEKKKYKYFFSSPIIIIFIILCFIQSLTFFA